MLIVNIATKLIILLFSFLKSPQIQIMDSEILLAYSEDNAFSTSLLKQKDILVCSLKNGENVF